MPWTFPSLFWASFVVLTVYTTLTAGQANRTLDDFSPQIVYTPAAAVTHLNTTGFDVTKLYNGTIGIMNASASTSDTVNMTMQFTGTAVWLFLAKPPTTDTFSTSFTIFLDGVDVNDDAEISVPGGAEYADLAYSNTDLHLAQHSVVLSTSGVVYFDYGVFTSNNPEAETTIPPVQPPSSSASSSTKSKVTGQPPAESQPAVPKKSTSHVAAIAGAAVCIALVFGGGVALLLLCRRRRTRSSAITPSTYGHQGGLNSSSNPYSGEAVYRSYPAVPTSEAALLQRVPTSTSPGSRSGYTPSPSPAMINQPPYQFQSQSQRSSSQLQNPFQSHSPYNNLSADQPYGQQHESAVQRMLAEQRAIEAEYARPTAWIVDQKAPVDVDVRTPVEQHLVPSPDTRSISPGRSASTPYGHGGDPLLSNMAAEMVALRAQVARLEGGRHGGGGGGGMDSELPPPAYD